MKLPLPGCGRPDVLNGSPYWKNSRISFLGFAELERTEAWGPTSGRGYDPMDTWTLRWHLLLEFLLNLATWHVTWAQTTEDASRTWSRPEPTGPGGQCPRGVSSRPATSTGSRET